MCACDGEDNIDEMFWRTSLAPRGTPGYATQLIQSIEDTRQEIGTDAYLITTISIIYMSLDKSCYPVD